MASAVSNSLLPSVSRADSPPSPLVAAGVAAALVLVARGLLQLREAVEAERLREAHDGRAGGVRAPGQLLGRLEGGLLEVVDDVAGHVLLGARELLEAIGDVGGERHALGDRVVARLDRGGRGLGCAGVGAVGGFHGPQVRRPRPLPLRMTRDDLLEVARGDLLRGRRAGGPQVPGGHRPPGAPGAGEPGEALGRRAACAARTRSSPRGAGPGRRPASTSGRPRWKIRNMSTVHCPTPFTWISSAATSSSASVVELLECKLAAARSRSARSRRNATFDTRQPGRGAQLLRIVGEQVCRASACGRRSAHAAARRCCAPPPPTAAGRRSSARSAP